MLKKLLIATAVVFLIIALAIWQAPARLAANALANNPGAAMVLLTPRGTLWNGSGQLLVDTLPIGEVRWQVQPSRLLALEAAVSWQLVGAEFNAQGVAAARSDEFDLRDVQAQFSSRLLAEALAPYDIAPSGDLTITNLNVTQLRLNAAGNWPEQMNAEGLAHWSGGDVQYRLAGQDFDISLPPLQAVITTADQYAVEPGWPEMLVTAEGNSAPLLTGRLTPRGSAAIGITRGLTRLAGQPWPGSEPDHVVVLEVEEQLI